MNVIIYLCNQKEKNYSTIWLYDVNYWLRILVDVHDAIWLVEKKLIFPQQKNI